MIKIEHNTLVLDTSHTKEDQKAISDFLEYRIRATKVCILKAVDELESQSQKTRTPLYQETMLAKIRKIVNEAV